jgi:hypothetical protein
MQTNAKMCVLTAIALIASGIAHADVLWSIGQKDGTYAEFAIAGSHSDYNARFPNDVTYVIRKNKPGEAWPFIHPGPADSWAGSRTHPFRIEFNLGKIPKGLCRFTIDAVSAHGANPPLLEVNVNDKERRKIRFEAGGTDAALNDPRAGRHCTRSFLFPPTCLKPGRNQITLTVVENSWLLYDAVSLEVTQVAGTVVDSLEASSTPLFRTVDGQLKQAVRAAVNNAGIEGDAELSVDGIPEATQGVKLQQGDNVFHLLVPPFSKPEQCRVTVRVGDKKRQAEFEGRPERRWKVFVAPSAHTDIGYTDLQEKIFLRHNENTAAALKACETNPDFKWDLEVFAQADWFREKNADSFPELEKCIREGRIGLTGLYLNMLTGICSGEEMVKVLAPAQEFGRTHNVAVTAATLTDVPTAVGTLPMFLKQAGIRYFVEGVNEDRGPVFSHADKRMVQSPFWWEALDGSRVLALFTRGYAQAAGIGLRGSVATVEQRLPGWLRGFDRPDYPCNAVYVNGAFSDNEPFNPHYAEVATEWNRQWEYPKIIVSRVDEFFRYVEDNFGQALPVFCGDMGSYWEDGAASSATETGMVRIAKARLNAAERWRALAAAQDPKREFPRADFAKAWEDAMYYDEHTWGASGSISDPNGEQTVKQWEYKAAYARRARERAGDLCLVSEMGLSSSRTRRGAYLTVANACSWPRDIEVAVPDAGRDVVAQNAVDGRIAPSWNLGGKLFTFVAQQVPPMGYRRYKLNARKTGPEKAPMLRKGPDQYTWETPSFRYRIDPKTGAFSSIEDLRTHREWVDTSGGYGVNQFLYVTGGNDTSLIHPGAAAPPPLQPVSHVETNVEMLPTAGGLLPALLLTRKGPNLPRVTTACTLCPDGHLQLVNVVEKEETT